MKFQIVHESSGRMRIHCAQKRMRLEQADLLEAYLQQTGGVRQAVVHERTCCAVIHYQCAREELLQRISRFAYDAEGVAELAPLHSSRALNRTYEEKLVGRIAFKAVRSLFFPAPLRIAYTLWKSRTCSAGSGACCGENCAWSCSTGCPSGSPWCGGILPRPVP